MISRMKDVQYKLFAFVCAQFIIVRNKMPSPSKAADGMKMEESGNNLVEQLRTFANTTLRGHHTRLRLRSRKTTLVI